jgi:hypothetical protein
VVFLFTAILIFRGWEVSMAGASGASKVLIQPLVSILTTFFVSEEILYYTIFSPMIKRASKPNNE